MKYTIYTIQHYTQVSIALYEKQIINIVYYLFILIKTLEILKEFV